MTEGGHTISYSSFLEDWLNAKYPPRRAPKEQHTVINWGRAAVGHWEHKKSMHGS